MSQQHQHQIYGDGGDTPDTAFAPAERATRANVEQSIAALSRHPLLRGLLDAADVSVVVLNRERQILVGNATLLAGLGVDGIQMLEGLRPGEALGCVHAWQCAGGCGTSPECATCGAAIAIVNSQRTGGPVERECLMTVRRGEGMDAYELRVKASQIELSGETFTIVGLRDISAEKRRAALERIFLHDIANTLTPLLTSAQLLELSTPPGENAELVQRIATLAGRLQREIEDQRVLLSAENGTLEATPAALLPETALDTAASVVRGHPVARQRTVEVAHGGATAPILADESLLVRVLVNMMKNALEATPEGGVVRAWAERPAAGGCALKVWNAGVIDGRIALQIFKRSFSTKEGHGRGLGTFSMKLFGERYLGGTVGFTSTAAAGTTFFIRLPE
ncbi:MAG TPA: HAMP domain-containing sensor histidine kinase [Polyangia bacterium]|jgi:signal transduction histidine kinase